MNMGVYGTNLVPQPTFVDYKIMLEFRYIILQAAENSVLAALVFIRNSNLVK